MCLALFIGSYFDGLDQLFQVPNRSDLHGNNDELIEALRGVYDTLVTDSEGGKHDTLVP